MLKKSFDTQYRDKLFKNCVRSGVINVILILVLQHYFYVSSKFFLSYQYYRYHANLLS